MTYRGFVSRAELGLMAPRARSTNIEPERGGVAIHYAGPAQRVSTHASCVNRWRSYQRHHMHQNGWVDIAYTMGACRHGFLLAGRGAGVRTAATGPANGTYYAICGIIGAGESPTTDMYDAVIAGIIMLRREGSAGDRVRPHSDFMSTACPGNYLRHKARVWDNQPLAIGSEDPLMALEPEDVDRIARRVSTIPLEEYKLRHEDGTEAPRQDGTIAQSGFTMLRLTDIAATYARANAQRGRAFDIYRRESDHAIYAMAPGYARHIMPDEWRSLSQIYDVQAELSDDDMDIMIDFYSSDLDRDR